MRKLFLPIFLLALAAAAARQELVRTSTPPEPPKAPRRIVSLAPSVTQTLYALGLGDNVVGVTQFCKFPPEAEKKPHMGGFGDVNFEAVVRARPDLAVIPIDKTTLKGLLEHLGIPVFLLDTRSLSGLLKAIHALGRATGKKAEAEAIISHFQTSLQKSRQRAMGRERPRVLFAVMHSYQDLGYITEINIIGRDGFFNELIEAAGGENAYTGQLAFPRLSREAIIFLNPDVIIDIIPKGAHIDMHAVLHEWHSLENVKAIKNDRCFLLTDRTDTVPGPRSVLTLEKLSRIFHPAAGDPPLARIIP